jgi:hypothetical protein
MNPTAQPSELLELAWTHLEASVVTYPFTLGQFGEAMQEVRLDRPVPEPIRSVIHEQQHLFCSLATNYGLFVARLRALQTAAIHFLLVTLKMRGIPIKLPLDSYCRTLPDSIRNELRTYRLWWIAAEWVLAVDFGLLGRAASLFERYLEEFPELSYSSAFTNVQSAIAAVYETTASNARTQGMTVSARPGRPSSRELAAEHLSTSVLAEVSVMAMDDIFGLVPAMESGGLAAELWGVPRQAIDKAMPRWSANEAGLLEVPDPLSAPEYVLPLVHTLAALPNADPEVILRTHMSVCDLALMGPVLPEHMSLRHGLSIDAVSPLRRMWELLKNLRRFTPVRSRDDYIRFTEDACEHFGWPTVQATLRASVTLSPPLLTDPPDIRFYGEALRIRTGSPSVFVSPEVWLGFAYDPFAKALGWHFTFPIIQFSDQQQFHKDKEMLALTEFAYLWNQWHRRLYLGPAGRSQHVRVPWRSTRDELERLTTRLADAMTGAMGGDFVARPILSAELI